MSRLAASRYLGYLRGQKAAMTGEPGAHTNRPELVAVHGYDTKYAMHALRLGLQGIELLSTGRITLPVPNQIARTCAPSAGANARWPRSWRRSATPRLGWPRSKTAPRSPTSRTVPGSTAGCTAATRASGTAAASEAVRQG